MTINRFNSPTAIMNKNCETTSRKKSYTDIDIDYKNFEQFQQSTRLKIF